MYLNYLAQDYQGLHVKIKQKKLRAAKKGANAQQKQANMRIRTHKAW